MTLSVARSARRRLAHAAAIAVTAAALPIFTLPAFAADPPAARPQPGASRWTGFYIGIHGGAARGSTSVEDPSRQLTPETVSLDSDGWVAGAQVGANWQFGNFVVGGEIDAAWASVKGSAILNPTAFFTGYSTNLRALATGTGRVGYAVGDVLAYGKFGVAWADIEFASLFQVNPIVIEHSRTGLTAGGGLEVALGDNLSVKVEYDFITFGSTSMSLGGRNSPANVDHDFHLLKGGVNWRFGGD